VWDLYGGYGALGFAVGGGVRPVTVMDISSYSERTFAELARMAGNTNSRFLRGDLLVTLPTVVKSIAEEDLVVLDPPRSGAHPEVLTRITRSRCRRVIYLSCNAARLARDLRILKEHRFAPTEIQPYDFFPQTPTIETLVILQR
jgi:23S rRNA (uracil1939-C5)-methyltransferase